MSEFRLNFGNSNDVSSDVGNDNVTIETFLDKLKFDGSNGVFHQIVGIDSDLTTDGYVERVYVLFDELKSAGLTYTFVQGRLSTEFDPALKSELDRFWVTVSKIKDVDVDKILRCTYDFRDWSMDKELVSRVRVGFKYVLERFMKHESNLSIIKNFFVKMWAWIDLYIDGDLYDSSVFVYLGDSKRDEVYFLMLLNMMGSNILVLSPNGYGGFAKADGVDDLRSVETYASLVDMEVLPKRLDVRRVETFASKASREIHSLLHSDEFGIYTPWQFEDYGVQVTALDTTYEEILILWNEPANMRTGFSVKDGVVSIPSIFAKVVGVPEIVDNYWIDVADLREGNTVFKESVPFTNPVSYHKYGIIYGNDGFTLSDVRKLKEYKFNHVRESMQEMMIERLNKLIDISEEAFRFDGVTKNDFKYRALHTVLSLDSAFIDQIQKFDYAQEIPKLVVFDGDDKVCSEDDAIVMMYLHLIGFDIVVLTPTGYQNIEHLINKVYFDVHKNKRFEMGLTLPSFDVKTRESRGDASKKSWLRRLLD